MSEYIFRELERSSYITADTFDIITTLEKKERIVRCKYCKRSWVRSNGDVICRHRRFGLRETEFDLVYVEPNGFCAWGERRDDA